MVEVFKTNVQEAVNARLLIRSIQRCFPDYNVNFDLDDCDRILRVKSSNGLVDPAPILNLLKAFGFEAEVLGDEIYPPENACSSPEYL